MPAKNDIGKSEDTAPLHCIPVAVNDLTALAVADTYSASLRNIRPKDIESNGLLVQSTAHTNPPVAVGHDE